MSDRPDPVELGLRIAEYLRCLECGQPGAIACVQIPRDWNEPVIATSYCGSCWSTLGQDAA